MNPRIAVLDMQVIGPVRSGAPVQSIVIVVINAYPLPSEPFDIFYDYFIFTDGPPEE